MNEVMKDFELLDLKAEVKKYLLSTMPRQNFVKHLTLLRVMHELRRVMAWEGVDEYGLALRYYRSSWNNLSKESKSIRACKIRNMLELRNPHISLKQVARLFSCLGYIPVISSEFVSEARKGLSFGNAVEESEEGEVDLEQVEPQGS